MLEETLLFYSGFQIAVGGICCEYAVYTSDT
jgi:hypothetical protein